MTNTLNQIYSIFKDNISLVSYASPKSAIQYNPGFGFKCKQCYPKSVNNNFELLFPQLLAEENFAQLLKLIEETRRAIQDYDKLQKSYRTYSLTFLSFLEKVIIDRDKKREGSILNDLQSAYHIDGSEKLVELLGGEEAFIKKALEDSYFFSKELVDERFDEIIHMIGANKPVPARWAGQRLGGQREQCGYLCDIDTNGNAKVRSVILDKTGYTVSGGKTDFINYKISHIWGNAKDPRYFTNLWNVVLVPAWANDLLDKTTSVPGSLASKFLNAVKAICMKIYDFNNLAWGALNMNSPCAGSHTNVRRGVYQINIIHKKNNGNKGKITTINVCLP